MSSPETIVVLNRVLAILARSFPQYVRYAHPYTPGGNGRAMGVIDRIVSGEDALAERVSRQVVSAGARPDSGQFPMEFTDSHDLGIDYLIREAIGYQKQDIAELERCVDALSLAPVSFSLAAEALRMAKGHLELLEALAVEKKTAGSCQ